MQVFVVGPARGVLLLWLTLCQGNVVVASEVSEQVDEGMDADTDTGTGTNCCTWPNKEGCGSDYCKQSKKNCEEICKGNWKVPEKEKQKEEEADAPPPDPSAHHTTHGCKCLEEWKFDDKEMKYCSSSGSSNGRKWCQVSKDCKSNAGTLAGRRRSSGVPWDYCFDGPDPRTHQVLTMDPCLVSVQAHNGEKPWRNNIDSIPRVKFPRKNEHSNAVCCSKDGKSCGKFKWDKTGKINMCLKDLKYEAAKKWCEGAGYRLCTPKELTAGVCCYRLWNECNIRNSWSSKEIKYPENWGEKEDVKFKGGPAHLEDFIEV